MLPAIRIAQRYQCIILFTMQQKRVYLRAQNNYNNNVIGETSLGEQRTTVDKYSIAGRRFDPKVFVNHLQDLELFKLDCCM